MPIFLYIFLFYSYFLVFMSLIFVYIFDCFLEKIPDFGVFMIFSDYYLYIVFLFDRLI